MVKTSVKRQMWAKTKKKEKKGEIPPCSGLDTLDTKETNLWGPSSITPNPARCDVIVIKNIFIFAV